MSERELFARGMLAMSEVARRSRLPRSEPPIFDGSKLQDFHSFIASFKCHVSENCESDAERYRYLLQFTAGDANKLVIGCFNHRDDNLSYAEAIRRLQKHYGDRYRLAQHYVQKLQSWPGIKGNDARAASELSHFLAQMDAMMGNDLDWAHLNSPREIALILDKLLYGWRQSWVKKVQKGHKSGR